MALAVNRTGTVFKKCDRSNHKPDSNKNCAADTCQHTCQPTEVGKCPHAWTLRYWVDGKQLEKSFRDEIRNGRVVYGSGKKLAQDHQLKLTVDKRAGDKTFADYTNAGKANFGAEAEKWISRQPIGDRSKGHYLSTYRNHVRAVFGDKTLSEVARDRDGVQDLLQITMKELSITLRQQARLVIVGTLDEAVKAEKIGKHRLSDIELLDDGPKNLASDFVFPTFEQVKIVANGRTKSDARRSLRGAGICVWIMRGCGLRIEEALAVEKSDFIEEGTVLRVMWQADRDGRTKLPLKHRKKGEYRDVPVPAWLWELVKDMPEGPLLPGNGRTFQPYVTVRKRFAYAAKEAGIEEGFTPHSLRHAYASAMLRNGVPISELAHYLGHRDINVTHSIYGHLLPSSAAVARAALAAEYTAWTAEALLDSRNLRFGRGAQRNQIP
jgi:integrase